MQRPVAAVLAFVKWPAGAGRIFMLLETQLDAQSFPGVARVVFTA